MEKRKRQANPGGYGNRREMLWKSLQEKCHPAMFELAQLFKESIEAQKNAGPNASKTAVEAIVATLDERSLEIHKRYPDLAQLSSRTFIDQSIYSDAAFAADSDSRGIFEWLHFARHKIPLKEDLESVKKGDWDASRRVQRTVADAEQIRCGGGRIKPFKGNLDHSNIFEALWGLGIERLTEDELADFFDKYCPCGNQPHKTNALQRHRARFQRMLPRSDAEQG